ncbi:hypothetical protein TrST_g7335 [Triparma strigata]|uniref:Uncharacterized protein n=1 Tax=Triparma strigata TaxID=1606541 RepID=A0A9W7BN94_9STRA|nr:hypothetical protein TrST_g7335 [Triparma strigata]
MPTRASTLALVSYAMYELRFLSLGSGTKLAVLIPRASPWGAYSAVPSSDVTRPVMGVDSARQKKMMPTTKMKSRRPMMFRV